MVSFYACLLIFCMFSKFLLPSLAGDRIFLLIFIFHRIIERLRLEGTFRDHLDPTHCHGPPSCC